MLGYFEMFGKSIRFWRERDTNNTNITVKGGVHPVTFQLDKIQYTEFVLKVLKAGGYKIHKHHGGYKVYIGNNYHKGSPTYEVYIGKKYLKNKN